MCPYLDSFADYTSSFPSVYTNSTIPGCTNTASVVKQKSSGSAPSVVKPRVPTRHGLKKLNQQFQYTRHPHYPEVKLNTRVPQMTISTMSNSNLSCNNDGGNNPHNMLRDLSDTNSALEEPLASTLKQPVYQTGVPTFGTSSFEAELELLAFGGSGPQ